MSALNLITLGTLLTQRGLAPEARGSLSYADRETLVVTAPGIALDRLTATALVPLHQEGRQRARGQSRPTPAWPFHVAAHRGRPAESLAALITPPRSLTLGLLGIPLPLLIPDHYHAFGGPIPCIESATLGQPTYFEQLSDALRESPIALLQNIGLIVMASSTAQLVRQAEQVESASALYLEALAVGDPVPLSRAALLWLDRAAWWEGTPD